MIGEELAMEIRVLAKHGKGVREIAREVGCSRNTVLFDTMKTVVVARDAYGSGKHRFNPAFLDFAKHAGFRPKLCRPYRAQTKGKVERFIRYVRGSFWVPLASRLRQEGLEVDRELANVAVSRWLREVANARVHATTGEIPHERLEVERAQLLPLPAPYGGKSARPTATVSRPIVGIQHPLAMYDGFASVAA